MSKLGNLILIEVANFRPAQKGKIKLPLAQAETLV
jgi:hypothetical protein